MKGAKRARSLSFWFVFLQRLLAWSPNFKSQSIFIPTSISFVFDSVEGSLQLRKFTYKVILITISFHKVAIEPYGSDDAYNVLITNSSFLTVCIVVSFSSLFKIP